MALKGVKSDHECLIHPKCYFKNINLSASTAQLERTLAIMNTLLHAFEQSGVTVYCPIRRNPDQAPPPWHDHTSGTVSLRWAEEEIKLSIRETRKRSLKLDGSRWDLYQYPPTELQEIKVGNLEKRVLT